MHDKYSIRYYGVHVPAYALEMTIINELQSHTVNAIV